MPSQRKPVLIGDKDQERFRFLWTLLEDHFGINAVRAETFDDLKVKARDSEWKCIFIADDLPYSLFERNCLLFNYLAYLSEQYIHVKLACIVGPTTELNQPSAVKVSHCVVHSTTPTRKQAEETISGLETALGTRRLRRVPNLQGPKTLPLVLQEQIRSLSPSHDLDEGKSTIEVMVRDFSRCAQFEIHSMGQGLSGAMVFRIRPIMGTRTWTTEDAWQGATHEFVLKVCSVDERWKVRREIEQCLLARKGLGTTYRRHIPSLLDIEASMEEPWLKYAACHRRWYGICYDYLGQEGLEEFIDLERALIGRPAKSAEISVSANFSSSRPESPEVQDTRKQALKAVLYFLCEEWYLNTKKVRRESCAIWKTKDGGDNEFSEFPPYCLWKKRKRAILSYLVSKMGQVGLRLSDDWDKHSNRVRDFVATPGRKTNVNVLDRKMSVVLSPAHGDLNANNIFVWLKHLDQPFLIDFPLYQQSGHALQDFARLEVEIKLVLMDRQEDSPQDQLPAYDNTPDQVIVWKALEDHLLSEKWDQPNEAWPETGYRKNAEQCHEWVQIVRRIAEEVQRQGLQPSDHPTFLEEYLPALLFKTLQAIGWPSLSIFKRLLAVYSAAKILEKLEKLG